MERHRIERIRHVTRRRSVTVTSVEQLTPRMRRVSFTSSDLHDFVSASPDDHVKLFFRSSEAEDSSWMRDYTPRKFDARQGRLVIDFALHEAGPATAWAMTASVGDTLEIGGPRGSAVIPYDFDWYLFVGDETALPAIGRWIEEAGSGVPVTTVVVVDSDAEAQRFQTKALWTPVWVTRETTINDAALLQEALQARRLRVDRRRSRRRPGAAHLRHPRTAASTGMDEGCGLLDQREG